MNLGETRRDRLGHLVDGQGLAGLAVVLDKFGVVAVVGEGRAPILEVVVAGAARPRAVQHDDDGKRSSTSWRAVIFRDRLSAGLKLALDPSGMRNDRAERDGKHQRSQSDAPRATCGSRS